MRKDDINTLKNIAEAVNAGDRTLRDIAGECNYYKWQTNCQKASAIYGRLAECKTRKQFAAILETIDFGDTVSQLQALANHMDTITTEVLVVTAHNNLCTLAQAPKHLYATSDMKPSRFDELRAELNAFIYNK